MSSVLECKDLHRAFGSRAAVDGLSFEIGRGECFGLLGPNGAGKTTTIAMICGLLRPDRGSILVGGEPVSPDNLKGKAMIGFVPQEIALYPDLTAAENVRFFGSMYGLSGRALQTRAAEVLELVGLADRAKDRVSTFSGGMQRRANIAAGLMHDPLLLVLDEPTVGVDPQSRNSILEFVEALVQAGRSVLYTTHYMEEAERLCQRVGIIDEGRIVAEGTRRQLIEQIHGRDLVRVSATVGRDEMGDRLRSVAGVEEVVAGVDGLEVLIANGRSHLAELIGAATAQGGQVTSVEVVEPDLEAVFLALTGKALRD